MHRIIIISCETIHLGDLDELNKVVDISNLQEVSDEDFNYLKDNLCLLRDKIYHIIEFHEDIPLIISNIKKEIELKIKKEQEKKEKAAAQAEKRKANQLKNKEKQLKKLQREIDAQKATLKD